MTARSDSVKHAGIGQGVLAADSWLTNGALIADVAKLYHQPGQHVLDVTYGKGGWWTQFQPDVFTAHDLERGPRCDGVDFRDLPEATDSIDIVAFDPPYIAPGGRKTSTITGMNDAYGIDTVARNPAGVRELIAGGLTEIHRVLKPGGYCWAKCMNYISSGRLQPGVHWALRDAETAGFELVDWFTHVGKPGPQPVVNRDGTARRQVHARNNASTLLVLRAAAKPPAQIDGQLDMFGEVTA